MTHWGMTSCEDCAGLLFSGWILKGFCMETKVRVCTSNIKQLIKSECELKLDRKGRSSYFRPLQIWTLQHCQESQDDMGVELTDRTEPEALNSRSLLAPTPHQKAPVDSNAEGAMYGCRIHVTEVALLHFWAVSCIDATQ